MSTNTVTLAMERLVESRGYSGAQHWQEIPCLTLPGSNPLLLVATNINNTGTIKTQ